MSTSDRVETTKPHAAWREYLEALLVAGLFLGFTNTFVLKTFFIPSGSMEDTLLVGDHLVVNRYIFGEEPRWLAALLPAREPRRGDIVVFRSPEKPELDLVKRLIGVPGDTVEVRRKVLFVNGAEVHDAGFAVHKDPYVGTAPWERAFDRDNFGPVTVPAGRYFFMGDNRDLSWDSRYWGAAPRDYVKGRAFLIYWSYGGGTDSGDWQGWTAKLRGLADTAAGFTTRTRWNRTLRLPR